MLTMSKKQPVSKPEIKFTSPVGTKEYNDEFYRLYMKYTELLTDSQAKSAFLLKLKNDKKNVEKYSALPPKRYSPYGVYAKMELDGIALPVTERNSLHQFIIELEDINKKKIEKREQDKKEKSIKDSIHIHNFLGDLNYFIDCQNDLIEKNKKPTTNITSLLSLYNLSATDHQCTKELLSKSLEDMVLAKSKNDPQLVEAYSFLSRKQLVSRIEFLQSIYNVINGIKTTVSGVRTRISKPKKPKQLVKKLMIQDTCEELHLTSKDKENIIGSNLLYVYNTKTRTLIKYVSTSTFSVRGSTILNVNEEESGKKKIRKPPQFFLNINVNNRKFMERLWDSVKCKQQPTKNRLNSTTILLCCFN